MEITNNLESEKKLNFQTEITEDEYNENKYENETFKEYVKRKKYNDYARHYYRIKKNKLLKPIIKDENKWNFYNYLDAIKKIIIETNRKIIYDWYKDNHMEDITIKFENKINKLLNQKTYDELINKLII